MTVHERGKNTVPAKEAKRYDWLITYPQYLWIKLCTSREERYSGPDESPFLQNWLNFSQSFQALKKQLVRAFYG